MVGASGVIFKTQESMLQFRLSVTVIVCTLVSAVQLLVVGRCERTISQKEVSGALV